MDINNFFHVSRFEPYKQGHPNQPQQEAPPIIVEGERQYVPERILDGTFDEDTQRFMYLVHWEGYPDSEDTWEPIDELEHLTIFKRFRKEHATSPDMFPPARSTKPKSKTRRR
jgi:hypothetical protein